MQIGGGAAAGEGGIRLVLAAVVEPHHEAVSGLRLFQRFQRHIGVADADGAWSGRGRAVGEDVESIGRLVECLRQPVPLVLRRRDQPEVIGEPALIDALDEAIGRDQRAVIDGVGTIGSAPQQGEINRVILEGGAVLTVVEDRQPLLAVLHRHKALGGALPAVHEQRLGTEGGAAHIVTLHRQRDLQFHKAVGIIEEHIGMDVHRWGVLIDAVFHADTVVILGEEGLNGAVDRAVLDHLHGLHIPEYAVRLLLQGKGLAVGADALQLKIRHAPRVGIVLLKDGGDTAPQIVHPVHLIGGEQTGVGVDYGKARRKLVSDTVGALFRI